MCRVGNYIDSLYRQGTLQYHDEGGGAINLYHANGGLTINYLDYLPSFINMIKYIIPHRDYVQFPNSHKAI